MNDLISRQAAIDALNGEIEITGRTNAEAVKGYVRLVKDRLERLPSAQPERTVYENMSDEQFEEWLYEHGICHPDIHESIPCSAVPLLIDNAINELLPQEHKIILCKDCKHKYVDGDNVQYNVCELNHNKVQSDEWYCADAERREE